MSSTSSTAERPPADVDATDPAFPVEPAATTDEAATLPPKLQARLAAWYRLSGQFDRADTLLDEMTGRGSTAALLDERIALALARRDAAAVRTLAADRLASYPAPSAKAAFARALVELGDLEEAARIVEELLEEAPDLQTVQAVAAELALQVGDPSDAHDRCQRELAADPSRVAPRLLEARVLLLGGDPEAARRSLDLALGAASLTSNQLGAAAGLADLLGQPTRAQSLRLRASRHEAARAAQLATEIDAALGREPEGVASPKRDHDSPTPPRSNGATTLPESVAVAKVQTPLETITPADDVSPTDPRVLETLSRVFGHDGLRPGQAAVIERVLAGRDTLAILPTGAGKSLTFQLPSLLLEGVTLVLSPLIALMKDQAEGLPPELRDQTAVLNSTLSAADQRRTLDGIANGDYRLVYAAPERLRQGSFLHALRQGNVALVTIDEAHCISLWGHDFRPDYLTVPWALPELGNPPVLAITATATQETAASIETVLGRELDVVRTSSFRPNLFYAAEKQANREGKVKRLIALCRETPGPGIVYVSSRRDAETLAGILRDNGVRAVPYHAGLEPGIRSRHQERFMAGQERVVVATVAFGMGVDKRDVRFLVHFSPSTSLEAYAQESGRGGRDGQPSRCTLLFTSADRTSAARLAKRDAMAIETLREIYRCLSRHAVGPWAIFDPSAIVLSPPSGATADDTPDPRIGLGLLDQASLVRRHPNVAADYTLPSLLLDLAVGDDATEEERLLWQRLVEWARGRSDDNDRIRLQTAVACAALGIAPERLAALLEARAGETLDEGPRLPCYELLPAGEDASRRMSAVLAAAERRANGRVERMMAYAEGVRCRHLAIAEHLGERLDPCGVACDVCTNAITRGGVRGSERTTTSAADARALLDALATVPFRIGKPGLVKLLAGSAESRIQADRSPLFGALSGVRKSAIERLVDDLLAAGVLRADQDGEYRILALTPEARHVSDDELTEALTRPAASPPGVSPRGGRVISDAIDEVDEALLARLLDWRRERAAADAVPAYVVAPNAALEGVARLRPTSPEALERVPGFGPGRVERYRDEVLAIVAGSE
ncbi:MAG: ATP-dependent DNA helicase RecQ [uncultured Thermomicrobiales bacterium]|uniref:ATP-dependent DNA helicase RecQ n=1 Tax=uncultured Thermomicrobiales bacterium TaxID=1645740 RepID=A0A6J4UCT0_9BACT|nr:MAG: ATP-dependent DNA helicase RecQ [uncultured Thermomicrobiales bacterium]